MRVISPENAFIHLNPFMPCDLFYLNSLDRSISYYKGYLVSFLLFSCFVEISELFANNVDPDQMPHVAASDLGINCLPKSLLCDARIKWVNMCLISKFYVCINYMCL